MRQQPGACRSVGLRLRGAQAGVELTRIDLVK